MRPGQNKRMRGRNPNRRGPNPLTRSYESNGPDVKIRGTAHHVAEKYLQLARDAQSSGDPVMAESYLQHAEHYFRLIASAQQAQAQSQMGYVRSAADVDLDDDDDDFGALPDRFASPSERQPQNGPQPYGNGNGGDRPYNGGGERAPYNGDRQPYYNGGEQPGAPRHQERYAQDRNGGSDRNAQGGGQDRPDRQENRQDNRQDRGDRPYRNDRNDRNGMNRGPRPQRDGGYQGRNDYQARDPQFREQPPATQSFAPPAATGFEPQPVEGRRDPVGAEPVVEAPPETRRAPERAAPQEASGALPAFITTPVRPVAAAAEPVAPPQSAGEADFPASDGEAFPVRPRRRRRTRAEIEAGEPLRSEAPLK